MNRFWNEFQQFHSCKFPKIIKDILDFCGIDKSTFDAINEDIIKEIEETVNKNKSILKGSIYDKTSDKANEFKFLFGHRILLLSLPSKYERFKQDKNKQKKQRKVRLSILKHDSNDSSSVEESKTKSKTFEPELIRNSLITRLNNYAKNHGLNYKISEREIIKFSIRNREAFCIVNCPICEVKKTCTFVLNWNISNFTAHARLCIKKNQASADINTAHSRCPPANQSNFQPARNSVLDKVDQILQKTDQN